MRFLIEVDQGWQAVVTCEAKGRDWRYERTMSRDGDFPLPPSDDLPGETESHRVLCAGDEAGRKSRKETRDAINARKPGELHGGKPFGRYLFAALIGNKVWEAMKAAASDADMMELALSFPADEAALHRLPWEMMCGPDGFLATYKKTVAITRLVVTNSQYGARPITSPPKVLFVIGSSLSDSTIHAGAEYLGLLRQFKLKGKKRAIHPRELLETTPKKLKLAVKNFRPDVVFFVCHGDFDTALGKGYLELTQDSDDPNRDQRRFARQIVNDLRVEELPPEEQLPFIVVLSACQSGTIAGSLQTTLLGLDRMAPLAAELVEYGIPLVVGMAGRVSDLACRLFTKGFGEALLKGEPIIAATAEGRRAAFVEIPDHKPPDWAFPTVYLSHVVPSDYRVNVGEDDRAATIESWIGSYGLEQLPVFCGRVEFFEAYYELFEGEKNVLAIEAENHDEGMGKTRLLQELAMQALRDGHVPCAVLAPRDREFKAPASVLDLGEKIFDKIAFARTKFNLSHALDSQMRMLIDNPPQSLKNEPKLNDFIRTALSPKEGITPEAVRLALAEDLEKLIDEAHTKHPEIIKKTGRALVLLDALYLYDGPVLRDLVSMLGGDGFGKPGKPVPVIMVYYPKPPVDEIIADLRKSPYVQHRILKKFSDEGEDMLAYERVLMHPFKTNPPIENVAWVMNYEGEEQIVKKWLGYFRNKIKGKPAAFWEPVFYVLAEIAKDDHFLIEANDAEIFKTMMQRVSGKHDD